MDINRSMASSAASREPLSQIRDPDPSDVSLHSRSEQVESQQQRFAILGQMSALLMHESRNVVQSLHLGLALLSEQVPQMAEASQLVMSLQNDIKQLQRLLDTVRDFASPASLRIESCDVRDVWHRAWSRLGYLHRDRCIQLREEHRAADLRCQLDPFYIEQVFGNLLENALAACSDPVEIETIYSDSQIYGQPAIGICIRDNGPGLSATQHARVFQPFYTTKHNGSGLGLAIVKRIVEAHRGCVAVVSDSEPGAAFEIRLPRRPW